MENVRIRLWNALAQEIPLFDDDINYYLLREGIFTEDDLKIWKNVVSMIRKAYELSFNENSTELKTLIDEILTELTKLNPKKPLPGEMRIRYEDIKKNLEEVKKLLTLV